VGRLQNHFRNKLVAGALAAIPVAVTAFILWYVDTKARALLGVTYPFLGIVITVAAIYVLGFFITSLLGRFLLGLTDGLLRRIPGLRDLYQSWKQIALTSEGHEGIFANVVLIPDETGRLRMVGFTSGEGIEGDPSLCCVFVPASPNPTSGRLYFLPLKDCQRVDMKVQDALKLLISGGNYVPPAIGRATADLKATARLVDVKNDEL
jgi:uncharacterized membrane protein